MALSIRLFELDHTCPQVLVSKKKRPHRNCRDKAIRNDDGEPLHGMLASMLDYDEFAAELDLLAQAAFDLGREYEKKKK